MNTAAKIQEWVEAERQAVTWRADGQTIVFTNGCFDILHVGHVAYLEKARELGDRLVVGLNTDASVQRIKGAARPIVPQQPRARVLAALEFVDMVVLFDENTPFRLIQTIRPDILVKGDDYTPSTIVGADFVTSYGGHVQTIPLVNGFSTSSLIQKIKNL